MPSHLRRSHVVVSERYRKENVGCFGASIRNHKTEAVDVLVQEDLYRWINATVTASSHKPERVTPQRVIFPVKVEKDGEVVVTYSVKYTW